MPSTYSPILRLELPATGEQAGIWGVTTNRTLGTLIEDAIAGLVTPTTPASGSYTLATANGALDEARSMALNFTTALTGNLVIYCPALPKVYVVYNNTTGNFILTIQTATGVAVTIPQGSMRIIACDGLNMWLSEHNVALTGTPTAPTAALGTNTTQVATTAFAQNMQSPTFSGTPTAPTAALGTNTTQVATTAFAQSLQSPAFSGVPTAPTAAPGTNTTQVATTAFAQSLQSPAFSGVPTAPTAAPGTNTTQVATTAFTGAAVAVETTRAEAAEALLAPLAGAAFTGAVTVQMPTVGANPAPKYYVDAAISGSGAAAEWVSGNTYIQGNIVFSPVTFLTYRHITASSALTVDPSADGVNWVGLDVQPAIITASSAVPVPPGVYFVDTSGGVITLSLTAAIKGIYIFVDAMNTWGTHNLTIAGNGNNIGNIPTNVSATFLADVSDYQFSVEAATTYWRLV